jgi:hypothetical protein
MDIVLINGCIKVLITHTVHIFGNFCSNYTDMCNLYIVERTRTHKYSIDEFMGSAATSRIKVMDAEISVL